MICSYCYKTGITSKHDVSAWWNNPEDSVHVCSDECKDKLSGLLKDGKWMTHRPERMFRNFLNSVENMNKYKEKSE